MAKIGYARVSTRDQEGAGRRVLRLRAEGKMPGEIAELLGVSRMSVWRALKADAA